MIIVSIPMAMHVSWSGSRDFENIMIMGPCGSGKSTLARKIALRKDLRLIHMDHFYHLPNWVQRPADETIKMVEDTLAEGDGWVFEGNHSATMPLRLKKATKVILIEIPRVRCLWNVIKRVISMYGKQRPDSSIGCYERFDFEFLLYVWNFPKNNTPKIERILDEVESNYELIRISNYKQMELLLRDI